MTTKQSPGKQMNRPHSCFICSGRYVRFSVSAVSRLCFLFCLFWVYHKCWSNVGQVWCDVWQRIIRVMCHAFHCADWLKVHPSRSSGLPKIQIKLSNWAVLINYKSRHSYCTACFFLVHFLTVIWKRCHKAAIFWVKNHSGHTCFQFR